MLKKIKILGTCTSSINIHPKIQQNKKGFTQKMWEELARKMMYPI
jgi:hypothetical protein